MEAFGWEMFNQTEKAVRSQLARRTKKDKEKRERERDKRDGKEMLSVRNNALTTRVSLR